jgi:baculoviral IAP repeat-containing protein 7/8
MTPRMQRSDTLFECPPATLKLMSFKKVEFDVIIDEVDSPPDYRFEAVRLYSYKNWPVAHMKPERLAAAGFYFTGELDIVKCFVCGTEIYMWMEGDDPMVDHERQSPTCNFVRNIACGNVPAEAVPDAPPMPESRDVCGPYEYDLPPAYYNSYPTDKSTGAKYPEYKYYEDRLRTFEGWSKCFKQNPEQLSRAGFYYTGRGDQVLCYSCGVGVKDWEPDDDPWEQHAIWYPDCDHLRQVKGSKYVQEITRGQFISSGDLQTASYVAKVERAVSNESGTGDAKLDEEACLPGPSSQSSQSSEDSGIESMSSNSSIKGSNESLAEAAKPVSHTTTCKICYDAEVSQLFSPCGHVMACATCAKCIDVCPMCRAPVKQKIKVFFS